MRGDERFLPARGRAFAATVLVAAVLVACACGDWAGSARAQTPTQTRAQTQAPIQVQAPTQAQAPSPATPPPIVRGIRVERFEITGATRWSEDELRREVLGPWEGRLLDAEALESARRALTRWYVDRGYVNSGARVPDQEVRQGVVRLEVVEGALAAVDVRGTSHLDPEYLSRRLRASTSRPLALSDVVDRLRTMQELPIVETLRAQLLPGERPGEARLSLDVTEAPRWQAGVAVANNRPPSVGPIRTQLYATNRSLTGQADVLSTRYGLTSGLDDAGIEYVRRIALDDTAIALRADTTDASIVEAPFRELDIRSRTRLYAIGISRPLSATADAGTIVSASLERKRSDTYLLGEPFSFSPGVQDGRAVISALRLSAERYRRSAREALAMRGSLGIGVRAFGATVNDAAPDSRFVDAQAQVQYVRRLDAEGAQWVARLEGQWSADPLLPLEKFAIGGIASVRGYRENLLVRDQGLVGSTEWRHPLARLDVPALGTGLLQGALFADAGGGSNRGATTPSPRWIGSVGVALRLVVGTALSAELHYGHALRKVDGSGHDLQDRGIHFRVALQTR